MAGCDNTHFPCILSSKMSERFSQVLELVVAFLLGVGALGSGWAAYQSSQWGGTATENYGKAATMATHASTKYNQGIATASRDMLLDLQAKQAAVEALFAKDDETRLRHMTVAKYIYTQQMTKPGYLALGLPPEFHTQDKEKAQQLSDDAVADKGLAGQLGDKYVAQLTRPGTEGFVAADKTFAEGQRVSGLSTKFGLVGMLFTIALFLAGIALTLKSVVKVGFVSASAVVLVWAGVKLISLPWYQA